MASFGFWLQVLGALVVAYGLGRTAWSIHVSAKAVAFLERASARLLNVLGRPRMVQAEGHLTVGGTARATGSTRPARPAEEADLLECVAYLERYSDRVASEAQQELQASESRVLEGLDARDLEVQKELEALHDQLARDVLKVRTDGLWLAMIGAVATFAGLLLARDW